MLSLLLKRTNQILKHFTAKHLLTPINNDTAVAITSIIHSKPFESTHYNHFRPLFRYNHNGSTDGTDYDCIRADVNFPRCSAEFSVLFSNRPLSLSNRKSGVYQAVSYCPRYETAFYFRPFKLVPFEGSFVELGAVEVKEDIYGVVEKFSESNENENVELPTPEEICKGLDEFVTRQERAKKDANIAINDVDEVLLVGGTTTVHKHQKLLRGYASTTTVPKQQKLLRGYASTIAVPKQQKLLRGYASTTDGPEQQKAEELLPLDVTPLSIGIETLGGIFSRLINRNTPIPTKNSQVCSTTVDNQSQIGISVFIGEREIASDNKRIGSFEFVGIRRAPGGIPEIEITFDIDVNGIVTVFAEDITVYLDDKSVGMNKSANKKQIISFHASGGLSESEIEKMLKEAELHAQRDCERKTLIDIRNKADMTIYISWESLIKYMDNIPSKVVNEIVDALEDLKRTMASDDVSEIKAKLDAAIKTVSKIGKHI